jgi:hypothetical protein
MEASEWTMTGRWHGEEDGRREMVENGDVRTEMGEGRWEDGKAGPTAWARNKRNA